MKNRDNEFRLGWLDGVVGHWDAEEERIAGGTLMFTWRYRASETIYIYSVEPLRYCVDLYGLELSMTKAMLAKIDRAVRAIVAGKSRLKRAVYCL